jgi:ubiquitin-conjugating enzyme E2 W
MVLLQRLKNEIRDLETSPDPNIELLLCEGDSKFHIAISPQGIYSGQRFELTVTLSHDYPYQPPKVVFSGGRSPEHEHVYSNGHICLDILFDSWSPALTIYSVCLSIMSMLASAEEMKRPAGDGEYVKRVGSAAPLKSGWSFHDNKC